jgi:hypothetical protein
MKAGKSARNVLLARKRYGCIPKTLSIRMRLRRLSNLVFFAVAKTGPAWASGWIFIFRVKEHIV